MPILRLGEAQSLDGTPAGPYDLPSEQLTTHGVMVGSTGSGKTGALFGLMEETLRADIPVIAIDVKGDLPNLMVRPGFDPEQLAYWARFLAPSEFAGKSLSAGEEQEIVRVMAQKRREALLAWGITEDMIRAYTESTDMRLITPGGRGGEPLHILSGLERASPLWQSDPPAARASLSSAVSLLLRLCNREGDPMRSREHAVLATFAEQRRLAGQECLVETAIDDLLRPPIRAIGRMPLDKFISQTEREDLAAALTLLLRSESVARWRQGVDLDVASFMAPRNGKTPCTIISVKECNDEERIRVLGVVMDELDAWVRAQSGAQHLRALIVCDEISGFLPPHPRNPATKAPIISLLRQARAFGVGVVLSTQHPKDLDYRSLSNAAIWAVGRLQADADRDRVVDGMAYGERGEADDATELNNRIKALKNRWFVTRNAHDSGLIRMLRSRYAISLMMGPMAPTELEIARGVGGKFAPGLI